MFFKLIKIIIFISAMGSVPLSFHWYEGYQEVKKENKDASFWEYIKDDTKRMEKSIKENNLLKKAMEARNLIKKIALNKVGEALELYYLDHGKYPFQISEIVGEYLSSESKILEEPGFYYQQTFNGYELGIKLENGEVVKINKVLPPKF